MRTLQTRLVLVLFSFVLVSSMIIGGVFYNNSTNLVSRMIGVQALSIAEYAASQVEPAEFEAILAGGNESAAFGHLRQQLDDIRQANGLKFLYTMTLIEQDGVKEYRYIVDGLPEGSDGASEYGDVETDPDDSIIALFETGTEQAGELSRTDEFGDTLTAYVPIHAADGRLIGAVGADFDAGPIFAVMSKNTTFVLLTGAVLLLVALVVSIGAGRMLTAPLRRLTEQVDRAGKGDLTIQVDTSRKDEIGRLAQSFAVMLDSLRSFISAAQHHSTRLEKSASALTDSADTSNASTAELAQSMQEAAAAADHHLQRADETSKALEEAADNAGSIAAAASEASEASNETRTSAEQGTVTIERAAQQMELIREGNDELRQAVASMKERSEQIDELVVSMASIAMQTNILSLNAGIEAARAGEAGRGFAVVAGEIRGLAEQTTAFSEQIAEMIQLIHEDTNAAASAMDSAAEQVQTGQALTEEAGGAFRAIMEAVRGLDERFELVSQASQQLAAGIEEVTASVADGEAVVKQSLQRYAEAAVSTEQQQERMAVLTEESAQLKTMASQLSEMIGRYRIQQ